MQPPAAQPVFRGHGEATESVLALPVQSREQVELLEAPQGDRQVSLLLSFNSQRLEPNHLLG